MLQGLAAPLVERMQQHSAFYDRIAERGQAYVEQLVAAAAAGAAAAAPAGPPEAPPAAGRLVPPVRA